MSDLESVLAQALGERYTLVRELGRGGMARVFLAEERHPRRQVAIKVLEPDVAAALGRERFLREVELAASLTHPHILPIHSAGEAGGLLYYTMPYAEGQTLRDRLDGEQQLAIGEALRIAREVADALTHAHGRGVIHRDIKPENILLVGGHAVVSDFGIARAISAAGGERLTRTGLVVGTPAYMSPEQAADGRTVDGRSDQYALACVLYEMLAGQPPFTGPTIESIVRQHLTATSLPLTTLRPTVPRELEEIVGRALEKTPADRYATVAELADALRHTHTAVAATAAPGAAARRATSPTAVRSRVLRAVVVAALVIVFAVGGWVVAGRFDRADPAIRSVAVLPLANLTGDVEHDYFVDGMHDALIAEVAQIGTLVVISRQSVLRYRRSEASLPAIARELGVDALIEGSVFLAGDSVRITVQLVRAEPEQHLWASSFEGPLHGALGLHGQVARAIASAVHAAVTPELAMRLASTPPVDAAAQEAYLRGLAFLGEVELATGAPRDEARAAIRQFEAALEREPEWAAAHAKHALALHWFASLFHVADPDTSAFYYELSKAAALRALALDENEPQAHAALGWVLFQHEHDWIGAERAYLRALELDPNSYNGGYALYLAAADRHEEAAAVFQKAEQRHPLSLGLKRQAAHGYRCAGWHDLATARYEELLQRMPDEAGTMLSLGLTHLGAGRAEQAVAAMERAVAATDSAPGTLGWLGYVYARTGRRDEARALLDRFEATSPLAIPPELYVALGQPDRAIEQVQRRFETALDRAVIHPIRCSPEAGTLRAAPRYQEAVRRLGLPG